MFTTVLRGETSGITEERRGTIQDQASWHEYWKGLSRNGSRAPGVSFSEEMIVLLHLGTRATSGYEVEVTEIEDQGAKVVIHYEELIPGPHCLVAQIITYPFHIVKVRKTDGLLVFDRTERIQDC